MVAWIGFRQVPFAYKRDERFAGVTKYPLRKMIRFALDALTGFSSAPLKLASHAGKRQISLFDAVFEAGLTEQLTARQRRLVWGGLAFVLNFLPYVGPLSMMALLAVVGVGTSNIGVNVALSGSNSVTCGAALVQFDEPVVSVRRDDSGVFHVSSEPKGGGTVVRRAFTTSFSATGLGAADAMMRRASLVSSAPAATTSARMRSLMK